MLKKRLKADGTVPRFIGVSPLLAKIFWFGGLDLSDVRVSAKRS